MKSLRTALVVAALVSVPALALAQQVGAGPKLELGADLSLQYSASSGNDFIHLGAPMTEGDVEVITVPVTFRLGFLSNGPTSFEARVSAGLTSVTGSSGRTYYAIAPGGNVLYRLGGKSPNHNTYVTGGASVNVFGMGGGSTSSETYAIITFNAGVGMRRPWGAGALRAEAFVGYTLQNTKLGSPSIFHVGVHLGLSLLR